MKINLNWILFAIIISLILIIIYYLKPKLIEGHKINNEWHKTLEKDSDGILHYHPYTWSINEDYYLFFDLFARNDELIFISTAYDFYEIDFDSVNIKVNGTDVEIKDKHDFINLRIKKEQPHESSRLIW